MKLAKKLIVAIRDADGFVAGISGALEPDPSSNVIRSEVEQFDLSLENYGIRDGKATGDFVQFLDPHGSPQVSILLLPKYEPPVAACAIREILAQITSNTDSEPQIILVPYVVTSLKHNPESKKTISSENEGIVYGMDIGGTTEFSQVIAAETVTPPPSLRIHCEPLACLVHMVRVLKLPTVLLIAATGQNQTKGSSDNELEALYAVGKLLAKHSGLHISKDKIQKRPDGQSRNVLKEPWRALYG